MSVSVTAPALKMGTYMATRGFRNVEGTLMTRINRSIQDIVVKQITLGVPQ